MINVAFYTCRVPRLVIFVCNYPGMPHVAAAIWPWTCLFMTKVAVNVVKDTRCVLVSTSMGFYWRIYAAYYQRVKELTNYCV